MQIYFKIMIPHKLLLMWILNKLMEGILLILIKYMLRNYNKSILDLEIFLLQIKNMRGFITTSSTQYLIDDHRQ